MSYAVTIYSIYKSILTIYTIIANPEAKALNIYIIDYNLHIDRKPDSYGPE